MKDLYCINKTNPYIYIPFWYRKFQPIPIACDRVKGAITLEFQLTLSESSIVSYSARMLSLCNRIPFTVHQVNVALS